MKLLKTREENLEENYLELHYGEMDSETAAILDRLRPSLKYIEGCVDGKRLTYPLSAIFYFETVDRKTFAYTQDTCMEVKETLQSIIEDHKDVGFVRISKSGIVNLYQIKKLQGDLNMRTRIYLKNDECLVMNRGYRTEFYEALKTLQGRKKHETH
ncbi:MAG: LytTR family transcriptional regulator DNA-binding domain-containing protein [Lachnospiraceae bacterium]|nr:LytTR family transcriptional regulator DNA-binding domain-containing protein [Lachnospiraceae bacterium]